MYSIGIMRRFSAAHKLADHPGRCSRLHGHTWSIEAVFSAEEVSGTGMIVDFDEAALALDSVIEPYDHVYLNEVEPFAELPPTAENVAQVVFTRLAELIGSKPWPVDLESVTVWESPDSWASYAR